MVEMNHLQVHGRDCGTLPKPDNNEQFKYAELGRARRAIKHFCDGVQVVAIQARDKGFPGLRNYALLIVDLRGGAIEVHYARRDVLELMT